MYLFTVLNLIYMYQTVKKVIKSLIMIMYRCGLSVMMEGYVYLKLTQSLLKPIKP